jgi:hypothetical protein
MPKSKMVLYCAAALSIPALLVVTTPASAQKKQKISYEEAFKRCKAFIDKEKGGLAHSTTNELTRTSRGAACMQKFGHRL